WVAGDAEVLDDNARLPIDEHREVGAVVEAAAGEVALVLVLHTVLEQRVRDESLAERLHVLAAERHSGHLGSASEELLAAHMQSALLDPLPVVGEVAEHGPTYVVLPLHEQVVHDRLDLPGLGERFGVFVVEDEFLLWSQQGVSERMKGDDVGQA